MTLNTTQLQIIYLYLNLRLLTTYPTVNSFYATLYKFTSKHCQYVAVILTFPIVTKSEMSLLAKKLDILT